MLPEAERQLLLNRFNNTATGFAPAEPIHALFETQVRANPEAIALVCEDRQLSYRQLNRRANHLARQLLASACNRMSAWPSAPSAAWT
ncbi:hypothetical protein QNM99_28995 [Pseudomonas sp. PCH446]